MTSKYIPPSRRNRDKRPQWLREEEEKKARMEEEYRNGLIDNDKNFPSLSVKTTAQATPFKTSFASLATEWNEIEEEAKMNRELRAEKERRDNEKRMAEIRNYVPLHKQYHDGRNELIVEDYDDMSPPTETVDDDGWTIIEKRKPKKELTIEEKLLRDERRELEEQANREDESVWNFAGNDDWDYRDRRAVA